MAAKKNVYDTTRHTINELLVGLFNYILYIEDRNLKEKGVPLTMTEVHILENIEKTSDNSMSHIAGRMMVTQGTLTTNVGKLIERGYVERQKDEVDRRIVRLTLTEKAKPILDVHQSFHDEMIDRAIQDLGLEENELLMGSLDRILQYFREEYRIKANI